MDRSLSHQTSFAPCHRRSARVISPKQAGTLVLADAQTSQTGRARDTGLFPIQTHRDAI